MITAANAVDMLIHSVQLTVEDDAEEVNKLYQYVHIDLLVIFGM